MIFTFNMKKPCLQNLIDENALHTVQVKLDAKILADSNYFCPLKQGVLQKSGIMQTVLGSGRLIWRTPYARKQYYCPYNHARSNNPNATPKWFETAKARHLKEWVALVKSELKK